MHKAVAARLANPSLSLYEALCIGGFDYSENDDKSVTDERKVTLGQRKNQLSRRLRLARKQGADENKASTESLNNKTGNHNGKNGISLSGKKRAEPKHLSDEHIIALRNELVSSAFNSSNDQSGQGIGDQQQMGNPESKRQRIPVGLGSTTFNPTCTMTPATQFLHQGLQMNNLARMGAHPNSYPIMARDSLNGSSQAGHFPSSQYFAQQMPNRITDQRYHHGGSAVALSSLTATAQSVGLTLEQLALTLTSNTNSLSKLIAEVRSGDSDLRQERMALDLHKSEVKGLYTKCLLMSGVDAGLAEPNTPTYVKFAMKAWEAEGERLRSLQNTIGQGEGTKNVMIDMSPTIIDVPSTSKASDNDDGNNDSAIVSSDSDGLNQMLNDEHAREHNHNHGHSHSEHNEEHNDSGSGTHDRATCDARHMHRLGDCGHRAIIHQPKDGVPHIDFIVNGQIECYGGNESVSVKSMDSAWPSKFRCKDLDDCSAKSCAKNCGKSVASTSSDWFLPEPKVFKLSEIDTGDNEWTLDTNEDTDDGVMGLFKLGKEAS